MKRSEKGLSPVIATVILIALVLTVAVIVFLIFRNMQEDVITKFEGTNVELVCGDVSFEAEYSASTLSIVNNGNVPIYRLSVKILSDGSYETVSLSDFENLNQGATYETVFPDASDAEKIILIPVLLGESEDGNKAYSCGEEFGTEIII